MASKLEKILNLLIKENKPLTTSEIALKETLEIGKVRVYLNTLYNDKRVIRVNDKKPYKYRANTSKALLKGLYEFLSNEEKCELRNINQSDINLIKTIKEGLD